MTWLGLWYTGLDPKYLSVLSYLFLCTVLFYSCGNWSSTRLSNKVKVVFLNKLEIRIELRFFSSSKWYFLWCHPMLYICIYRPDMLHFQNMVFSYICSLWSFSHPSLPLIWWWELQVRLGSEIMGTNSSGNPLSFRKWSDGYFPLTLFFFLESRLVQ